MKGPSPAAPPLALAPSLDNCVTGAPTTAPSSLTGTAGPWQPDTRRPLPPPWTPSFSLSHSVSLFLFFSLSLPVLLILGHPSASSPRLSLPTVIQAPLLFWPSTVTATYCLLLFFLPLIFFFWQALLSGIRTHCVIVVLTNVTQSLKFVLKDIFPNWLSSVGAILRIDQID